MLLTILYTPVTDERTTKEPLLGFGKISSGFVIETSSPNEDSSVISMHTAIATDLVNAVDCPQVFTFLTDTFPVDVPQVHVILVVPCPAVITAPVGTDHDCVSPVTEGVVNTKPV